MLVSHIESGSGIAEIARQMGVNRQTTSKRLARSRSGEGSSDRSSRPRRLAKLALPDVEEGADARPPDLAAATGIPARTCARIVARRVPHADVKKIAYPTAADEAP